MKTITISGDFRGKTVLRVIRRDLSLTAPCGGNGRCGKCKVRIISGELPPSEADRELLSEAEIERGVRLACRAVVNGGLELEILFEEKDFRMEISSPLRKELPENLKMNGGKSYAIAADIGTTTLVFRLIDLSTDSVLKTYSALNSQRKYGADIMARLTFAGKPEENELADLLRKDILCAVDNLCGKEIKVDKIILAGHTALFHFILGYPVKPLSVYPFESKMNGLICMDFCEVFDSEILNAASLSFANLSGCKIFFLPSAAAYAGSDLVAGIGFCDLQDGDILLDMGTNTEMALRFNGSLVCASAAAGPALEAGNISCGTGGIAGAVDRVSFYAGRFFVKTIDNAEPIGICGTGLIDALACLTANGIMDKTGYIGEKYQANGLLLYERGRNRIFLSQKDVREFQLAKAAIRAGLECLLESAGLTWDKVNRLYLAGGFGTNINKRSAVQAGLLPGIKEEKIVPAGNSSLGGAEKAALSDDFIAGLEALAKRAIYKNLSLEEGFQELFFRFINF